MQNLEELKNDSIKITPYLVKGFWKNFISTSGWVFTVLFAVIGSITNGVSLKIAILCLLLSVFTSTFYTFYSNIKQVLLDLENTKNQLESNKIDAIHLENLKSELERITRNRDTILENFEHHKNNAILFSRAYNSAKHSMYTLANMQNDDNVKFVIESLFENIEKEQLERIENNE